MVQNGFMIGGVFVEFSVHPTRDVMCCKVAGQAVEVTRKDFEEREFAALYDALKLAQSAAYNQYKGEMSLTGAGAVPREREEPALRQDQTRRGSAPVWREPRATPELELEEPSMISKLDVLMHEPTPEQAPDLILDGRDTLNGQTPNRACSAQRAATREK
jgi:hypothetical protein